MFVLGVSCFYHDSAAALLRDGVLVAASSEERFSRVKQDSGFPERAVAFCLDSQGINAEDLDYVVFYEKPFVKFDRILRTVLHTYPRSWAPFSEAMTTWFDEKLWIKRILEKRLGVCDDRLLFSDHHRAHAASAFFCSPFEEAAIVTADGVGEWTTTTIGAARSQANGPSTLTTLSELHFPHSLGLLYSTFTAFLGFKVNEGEYKVMGMAPFGTPRYVEEVRKLAQVQSDGSFWLDMDYFGYQHSVGRPFSNRFLKLFGEPRPSEAPFVTEETLGAETASAADLERNQRYADIAASIQRVTEDCLLGMASDAHRRTGSENLCLAGGVALNSVAVGRILNETPFQRVFVQPASGDAGGAVGAAQWAWHVVLGKPRSYIMEDAYLGATHGSGALTALCEGQGLRHERLEEDRLIELVVDDLLQGRVVGWVQGRSEWGPRALGNRSILADPRDAAMKEVVNSKVKFREPFRPFAPSVLHSAASSLFEGPPGFADQHPLRFMQAVLPWKPEASGLAPAVNHFGTGRLQVVKPEWNPRYHALISRFHEETGVPVLLNTSFNLRGEPIVDNPEDAWSTFVRSGLDVLVVDDTRIEKKR